MTPLAIVFMTVSVTAVVALAAWCYYRVLSGNGRGTSGSGGRED